MLDYERRCAEIIDQTALLASSLDGADLSIAVPTTPDWTLNQLVRHVGHAHRWADLMIRERVTEIPYDRNGAQQLASYVGEQVSDVVPWLLEGAASLSEALLAVDPDLMIATLGGHPGPRAWSRRMTHETVMHRWDVTNALGVAFDLDAEVARDTLSEWTALALPYAFMRWPAETAPLLGPGRSVHLHATDCEAEFVIDLTGAAPVVRQGHEKAAVALRGPVVELVLAVYRRRPVDGLEVFGDAELLDLFLDRVRF
ncbi:maleylpyruvate isomerase family mycothiol-dependent enzyme [Lentzea sp. NEAU-D13]|uniref:Maleylpyruvate isomerase family mycothiol-dependent enzyme n=1 Tax=Lentzea alba TaxID=2714351 RepID=A0A7C9RQJ5_9PSEU|nr:maleylpyruvate isomerase family mycothiol-dependent enzyme [Lentzea alba]NGY59683.1 maleylpyruvate isomerase family mycothiol-dependent enzyme [Lentzea alba]